MDVQADLFALPALTDAARVFPQFEIERPNCDYSGRVKRSEMPKALERLGFVVGQMLYHTGEVLAFPFGPYDEKATVFEVTYPERWTLTENMSPTIYLGDDNPIRQIIDTHGHLRGIVHCGWDMMPLSATIYTRYSVLDGTSLNFTELKIDRNDVRTIVVDRTKIDPRHPHKIDVPEHIDQRWLLAEKHPELLSMTPEQLRARAMSCVGYNEIRVGVSGSTLWLDEHYPDWRDPVAYWPR